MSLQEIKDLVAEKSDIDETLLRKAELSDHISIIEIYEDCKEWLNSDIEDIFHSCFTLKQSTIWLLPGGFLHISELADGTIWIHELGVKKNSRGQGVASRLLSIVKGKAIVATHLVNEAARNLYLKHKFVELGQITDQLTAYGRFS